MENRWIDLNNLLSALAPNRYFVIMRGERQTDDAGSVSSYSPFIWRLLPQLSRQPTNADDDDLVWTHLITKQIKVPI